MPRHKEVKCAKLLRSARQTQVAVLFNNRPQAASQGKNKISAGKALQIYAEMG
jgi:hypothetical protein